MASDTLSPAAVEDVSRTDPARGAELARALVAAHPEDEAAARLLDQVVREFAASLAVPRTAPLNLTPPVREAVRLLSTGQDEAAEIALRMHLRNVPDDVPAIRLMAQIAMQCGFPADALRILRHALEVDPASAEIWAALGQASYQKSLAEDRPDQVDDAIAAFDKALTLDPTNEVSLSFKAAVEVQVRRLEQGEASLRSVLAAYPGSAYAWVNLGFLLKTVGRFGEAVAAYRTAFAIDRACGPAWWGLANMKRARFFRFDLEHMEAALALPAISPVAATDIHFALSKALDDHRDYARAAEHLVEGNALRRESLPHSAEAVTQSVDAAIDIFTPAFFEQRAGWGHRSPAPIFILGMPRSGSTLVEQILSSHSQVEATEELYIVAQLGAEMARLHPDTPRTVEALSAAEAAALGERYIELAATHRRTTRLHFTDKNPTNWRQVCLIATMLPNARIIDVRRHPLDCGFANYVQHYRSGGSFSYGQSDIAEYYRNYVRLMRHIDAVLPGRVHRIIYEDLVDDLEPEVRRLLDYLGLEFEPACLRFFETERAILTPSSEQVRQPINRAGIGRWSNYEPWLDELKQGLGGLVSDWRD
ncbi:sulfotransferase [Sphingomonas sp.]|uniref:tetratricopeptide repeat-containing sulfotransferase family protein n=1 Tax=Sphingomonas sp. TaxID=28214 RepID=UPI00286EA94B|nr:sulfotransferase [Sphingomonas sp.]